MRAFADSGGHSALAALYPWVYIRFPAPRFRHATATATIGLVGLRARAACAYSIASAAACQNNLLVSTDRAQFVVPLQQGPVCVLLKLVSTRAIACVRDRDRRGTGMRYRSRGCSATVRGRRTDTGVSQSQTTDDEFRRES